MATVNLGSIKFKWKGTYNGATAYTVDDVVEYNGSSYICILASTGNLPTNATYFEQMSSAGTNGTDGTDLTTTLTTQGDIVYRDASGLARLGAGTSGQFLKTQGAGANPVWGTVEGISVAQQFRLAGDQSGSGSGGTVFTNWEQSDTDYQAISSAWSQSSGVFSTTATGIYLCNWTVVLTSASSGDAFDPNVEISTDSGSSYSIRSRAWGHIDSGIANTNVSTSFIFDVSNTSTFRLRFKQSQDNDIGTTSTIKGGTNENYTQINFIRLGAT